MKKFIIFLVVLLVLGGAGAGGYYVLKKNKENADTQFVYVEKISDIMGYNTSASNRYMGVVEAQATKGIEKDSDKKIKEIFVKTEDIVKEGDKLFEYDTDEMNLTLRKLELELTSINNQISTTYEQINNLVEERETVPDEKKMEYTAQIQNYQAQINQLNYDASAKQLEIDRQASSMKNAIVYSPMAGIIKDVKSDDKNASNSSSGDTSSYSEGSSDAQNAFITIMANGQYRVKGTGDEMTLGTLSEGSPVIIRSRLDENITWNGMISQIDREHPEGNKGNDYYDSGADRATKYPFYVELESIDGLMLGQHVYIENDYGQGAAKEGVWLYDFYIIREDGKCYVWVETANGRIEKREIILGEFDDQMLSYEVTAGLSLEDYVAYPEERIVDGMKTTRSFEESIQADGEGGIPGNDILPGGDPSLDDFNPEDFNSEDFNPDDFIDDGEEGIIPEDGYEDIPEDFEDNDEAGDENNGEEMFDFDEELTPDSDESDSGEPVTYNYPNNMDVLTANI